MRITKANSQAVKYACMNFHYAKSVPAQQYSYNVYNDNDEWCGCIIYSVGANNRLSQYLNCKNGECMELVRVALNGKQEQTSKAVAMSLKQLHKDNPLIKCVISYADHKQNHIGIIYQATNWLYLGISYTSSKQFYYKGKWRHNRTIATYKNAEWIKQNCKSRINSNKFRYMFFFDKKMKKEWAKKALPYPKEKDLTESE